MKKEEQITSLFYEHIPVTEGVYTKDGKEIRVLADANGVVVTTTEMIDELLRQIGWELKEIKPYKGE